jgi:hypothetical protein
MNYFYFVVGTIVGSIVAIAVLAHMQKLSANRKYSVPKLYKEVQK